MGRHAKGIADTRAALIAAAWELFGTVGYEATTVEGIVSQTGVSKGAFYHHFDSKEEMLEAVAERMSTASWEPARGLATDERLGAVEKVNRFLELLQGWKLSNAGALGEVARLLYGPRNQALLLTVSRRFMEQAVPTLAAIVVQGVGEGSFRVREPEITSRMVLHLVAGAKSDMMALIVGRAFSPEMVAETARLVDLLLDAMERLLGARTGAFRRPDAEPLEALCRRAAEETGGSRGRG